MRDPKRLAVGLLGLAAMAGAAQAGRARAGAEPALAYKAPPGWRRAEYAQRGGADPVTEFRRGAERIAVRLLGGPGSAYASPVAFLAGPAAATLGQPPERTGTARVAEREVALYRRGFPFRGAPPRRGDAGDPPLAKEFFCLLPLSGGRFAVLSYASEAILPDPERRGQKAWEAFLASARLPPP